MRMTRSLATQSLRSLAARGLLAAKREGAWVYYRPRADPTIAEAGALLTSLRHALRNDEDAVKNIYRLATAFTHPRRQTIYETLRRGDKGLADLRKETGISMRALRRHLDKLRDRGFVIWGEGRYRATVPPGSFAKALARLAPRTPR